MKTMTSQEFNANLDSTMHLYTVSMGVIKRLKEQKQMPSRFGIIKQHVSARSSDSQPEQVLS